MSWASLFHESDEPLSTKDEAITIPYGWVLLYYDTHGKMHEDSNCPTVPEVDLDRRAYDAIANMRKRWTQHHLLAGTYESYEAQDDLDDYGPLEEEFSSSSEDEDEQNEQLSKNNRYMDE